ncbi:unnamed protein product [Closterium sp. NIES-64]|nr:unnamed protein product [Closterium sp. NIES-64]
MFEAKIRARNQKARATTAAVAAVSSKSEAKGKAKRGRMDEFYGEDGQAARRAVNEAIVLYLAETRTPESLCEHPLFLNMLRAVTAAGPNYAVDCKAVTKSGKFIASVLRPIIERIGAEHVVALCTDGGSNYKKAGKLLRKEWPHLEIVPCATHVLDLLMEEVGKMEWAQVVVTQADNMISFVRGHQCMRAFLRGRELHGEKKSLPVLRPAGTRFGTQFLAVSRGRWKKVDVNLQVMELFYNVMRRTDSEAKGMMGQLYDIMLQLTEELDKLLEGRECKLKSADKEKVREHLRRRWDESLACPLHVAGRILYPANQEEGIFLQDAECTKVMQEWLERQKAFVDKYWKKYRGKKGPCGGEEGCSGGGKHPPPPPIPEGYKLEEDGEVEADEDDVCLDEWAEQEELEKEGEEEEEEEEEEEDEEEES